VVKIVFVALALLLPSCLQGAQFVLVNIGYAGGGPQGDYLLVPGKNGLISLKSFGEQKELPDVKADGIVAALEDAYPRLRGMIKSRMIEIDTERLVAVGRIYVLGQLTNEGEQPAATLAESMSVAEPTAFGAVKRIQVIRKEKRFSRDLTNKVHATAKLEPGDIILVPMKRLIGR
jgi:hypothetical protein